MPSRVSRIAKQLMILGLGGVKMSSCESFVQSCSDERENIHVIQELCEVVVASAGVSEEEIQADFVRDMEFPKKAAPKSAVYFQDHIELFPAPMMQKIGQVNEQINPEQLCEQLQRLLEKLREKIAVYEQKSVEDAAAASKEVPVEAEEIVAGLKSFSRSIEAFNAMYRNEMSHWKVSAVKPNVALGDLGCRIRQQQESLTRYLDSFAKAQHACMEMEQVGDRVKSLDITHDSGPQITDERLQQMRQMAMLLQ